MPNKAILSSGLPSKCSFASKINKYDRCYKSYNTYNSYNNKGCPEGHPFIYSISLRFISACVMVSSSTYSSSSPKPIPRAIVVTFTCG